MKYLDTTIKDALKLELHTASVGEIEDRLNMALQQETPFDQIYGRQLGESRFKKFLEEFEETLRIELCKEGKLRDKYANLLESGDTANILKYLNYSNYYRHR